jgi:16S rRNA (guanine1207-N2)-methyltransferase
MIAGAPVRVVSKAGLRHVNDVSAATLLLAEAASARGAMAEDARVLVIGSGHGALAVALARSATGGRVDVLDVHAGALDMAERTLRANDIEHAAVLRTSSVLPVGAGAYDVAAIEMPPNRGLARRWLVEAHAALREGGTLCLAGANNEGIQPIIADAAALFGNAASLGFKAKHRVARSVKGSPTSAPAWAAEQGIAPGTFAQIEIVIRGELVRLWTLPGVFAHDRLDAGTALLLDHLDVTPGARVLDAGCGLGILGIAAARAGAGHVDLIDASLLAVEVTAHNLQATETSHARVLVSDGLAAVANERYDLIVTNPPFHAGKGVALDVAQVFVTHGRQLLNPGGRIVLVANRFLRYDEILRVHYTRVERPAQTPSYHVLYGVC